MALDKTVTKTMTGMVVFLFLFTNVYLAFAQPISIECLVRKYDGPGGRMAGDIVSVKQLPHKGWGREEGPPNYVIIKVTDIGLGDFKQYRGRHILVEENKPDGERVRSKYRFDLTKLPNYSELSPTVEISPPQATANLIDRRVKILSSR